MSHPADKPDIVLPCPFTPTFLENRTKNDSIAPHIPWEKDAFHLMQGKRTEL